MKISSWNIICFGQKESINAQFFRLLRVLMKVHPIPHAICETIRSGFMQILYHCSVSWKITPLYFCSLNLAYFGQKEPIEKKLSDFLVVGWKFTKFLMSYLKSKVSFFKNLHYSSVSWEITFVCLLAENLYNLDKRSPSKCKISDVRLLTWNLIKFVLW